ncbi:putative MFS family arabinose efflux permease [Natranaerovirga pectinivora]|uniref:Putative MFS family arabinose efflux permease n=1 Tax=Natranaerovirga pectinivora TaxID=682400 RepID=A0A4R3MMT6_9FIRM|nr:OFA family MFS transporter [Natranaerovirga pectinivora]TCT16285.1 putative MFS family arabinose efflux permease [Natranaerovirga pectinivora]
MNKRKLVYVPVGVVMLLCLGTVYSWSVFRTPLEQLFNIDATQSGLPYMFFLAFYALLMPITGGFIEKYGPKIIVLVGGLFVGLGWVIAGFTTNIYIFTLAYGILGGSGVGIVYGVPLSVVTKWFPEKKGFLVGIILLGFGLSPFITAPLALHLIEVYGVMNAFKILGLAFLIIVPLLGLFLEFPPKAEMTKTTVIKRGEILIELIKSKNFIGLCICFMFGTLVGLMMIGITSPVGREIINLSPERSAMFVSIFSIFNGIGRPLFGSLTDKYGPKKAAITSYTLIMIASILMIFATEGSIVIFVIAFSLYFMNLGGWLAIAPTSTAIYFGQTNYSQNYGYVFTFYGIGAVIGTLLSGEIRSIFGTYSYVFPIIVVVALLGIITSLIFFKDEKDTIIVE